MPEGINKRLKFRPATGKERRTTQGSTSTTQS
jgi:hypothetical protein